MIFGMRKLESLGYRTVKKITENFNRLSRAHQRNRQTDRQQTDGSAIAYSERNVVRSLKSEMNNTIRYDTLQNEFIQRRLVQAKKRNHRRENIYFIVINK